MADVRAARLMALTTSRAAADRPISPAGAVGAALSSSLRLATTLFEVHADFFVQRVVPTIQHAAARINAQMRGPLAGLTPSTV